MLCCCLEWEAGEAGWLAQTKVVRGLVEEEEMGLPEGEPREDDAALLAIAEGADGLHLDGACQPIAPDCSAHRLDSITLGLLREAEEERSHSTGGRHAGGRKKRKSANEGKPCLSAVTPRRQHFSHRHKAMRGHPPYPPHGHTQHDIMYGLLWRVPKEDHQPGGHSPSSLLFRLPLQTAARTPSVGNSRIMNWTGLSDSSSWS